MKIKRIISIILVFLLVCPVISMAAATRRPQKLWPGAGGVNPTSPEAEQTTYFSRILPPVLPVCYPRV